MNHKITQKQMEKVHVRIPDAFEQLRQGRISRRDFLRTATLLGMSAGAATLAAACTTPEATTGSTSSTGSGEAEAAPAAVGGIVRGGTLRIGMLLQQIDHPARFSWVEAANVARQVGEYLTETGPDNLTRPFLLDSWEANDDVTEWTLNLKQGIKFNNGDEL
ncbi:MAG: hypothetical protein KDE46_29055, partial [Caldilineaceae bacterium]|nr:hypothetical protein [Caldilineaceae bacterium]